MIDPNLQAKVIDAKPSQFGRMEFVPDSAIQKIERDYDAARLQQSTPVISSIASHIRTKWQENRQAKEAIEQVMLDNARKRKGEYSADTLRKIKQQGGSEVYINITNVKCRAAESWMYDVLLPSGERPWSLEPTPLPDVQAEIEQELRLKLQVEYQDFLANAVQMGTLSIDELPGMIKKMERDVAKEIKQMALADAGAMGDEIEDELVEGGYYDALRQCIPDLITYPAAIMEGPTVYNKKTLEWATQPDGSPYANVIDKPTRRYRRVNPFDLYPAPGARNLDEGALIELIPLHRSTLIQYLGIDNGFDDDAIRLVLDEYGKGGLREWLTNDLERQELENRPTAHSWNDSERIDCIKFMGPVQGVMLRTWGMTEEQVPDPIMDYEITAYLIGRYVIKAKLNEHPLGKRNYFCSSFEESNDSVWGKGVPELMGDIQKICNGCARAMVNNMGHASGPMVWYNYNLMRPGEVVTGIHPWKVWPMKSDPAGGSRPPVGFFQPEVIVDHLLKIYEYFFKQASEVTGIPAYVYGSQGAGGGAADTASGLSMLMNAASKGLKAVASHFDNGIIKPSIHAHWLHIMLNEPERARGDINIVARASEYLLQQEQLQLRRNEFLNATNNPTDLEIIGKPGRATILREVAKSLKLKSDDVVPDPEDIEEQGHTAEIQAVFQSVAQAVGIPVEQVMAIAQQGGQPRPNQPAPQAGPTLSLMQ